MQKGFAVARSKETKLRGLEIKPTCKSPVELEFAKLGPEALPEWRSSPCLTKKGGWNTQYYSHERRVDPISAPPPLLGQSKRLRKNKGLIIAQSSHLAKNKSR